LLHYAVLVQSSSTRHSRPPPALSDGRRLLLLDLASHLSRHTIRPQRLEAARSASRAPYRADCRSQGLPPSTGASEACGADGSAPAASLSAPIPAVARPLEGQGGIQAATRTFLLQLAARPTAHSSSARRSRALAPVGVGAQAWPASTAPSTCYSLVRSSDMLGSTRRSSHVRCLDGRMKERQCLSEPVGVTACSGLATALHADCPSLFPSLTIICCSTTTHFTAFRRARLARQARTALAATSTAPAPCAGMPAYQSRLHRPLVVERVEGLSALDLRLLHPRKVLARPQQHDPSIPPRIRHPRRPARQSPAGRALRGGAQASLFSFPAYRLACAEQARSSSGRSRAGVAVLRAAAATPRASLPPDRPRLLRSSARSR